MSVKLQSVYPGIRSDCAVAYYKYSKEQHFSDRLLTLILHLAFLYLLFLDFYFFSIQYGFFLYIHHTQQEHSVPREGCSLRPGALILTQSSF